VILCDVASGKELWRTANQWEALRGLTFSADGRTLAGIAGRDGEIHSWEVVTGRERHSFAGHRGGQVLCFSASGALLASAGNDTTSRLLDVSWQPLGREHGNTSVRR